MKQADGWFWPDQEQHLLDWLANPKGRMILNGRPAYQGKKQAAALALVPAPYGKRRTAVDVGGHIGLWSYNLAHWFEKVDAFEPVALHRQCFVHNVFPANAVESFGLEAKALSGDGYVAVDHVKLHPFALGDREDMISIHTADTSTGDSWVHGKGTIPMRTLDSFGLNDVDFIKIDCEGYEEFVLRGAETLIETWRPVVVVEQKRDMATRFGLKPLGAVQFLVKRGYRTAQEISGDFIMVPR